MNKKIKNWYPVWSIISILLFLFVADLAFVTELTNFNGRSPFHLKLSFNLLLFFFLILSIYLSIEGIIKAKKLNGKGKKLSIILLILVSIFLLFIFYNSISKGILQKFPSI